MNMKSLNKSLNIYLRHQLGYLIFLLSIFVLPLGLFFQFSTYELPKVQYVFIISLFASQYVFYNEKNFRKKISAKVAESLQKEMNRVPSGKDIILRSDKVVYYRGVSIILSGLGILVLMVIFKEF